ncbi:unnamed protein product [Periconia digitata]|uniref:Uncharacterized protein n=1 Tax=Periconia digitata TaxID=1303443 RepID=A0A9W4XRE6_9PLEO|nr:unnamed protein product [Periconia digitata]
MPHFDSTKVRIRGQRNSCRRSPDRSPVLPNIFHFRWSAAPCTVSRSKNSKETQ